LEDAKYCEKCGAALSVIQEAGWERRVEQWGEEFGRSVEEGCFGFSQGGTIIGIIIGVFLLIVGISILVGDTIWRWIGPSFIIVIGLLIIVGVLSKTFRK
jgi:hypothetical protein